LERIIDPILTDISQNMAHFRRTDFEVYLAIIPHWTEQLLNIVGTEGCLALVIDYMEERSLPCSDELVEKYLAMQPMKLARNALTSLMLRGLPPGDGIVPAIQPVATA
jgi:hypothetical protein